MNRFLQAFMTSVMMLVALCLLPFSAYAAEEISVSIPVEIERGGTATVIPEVNCPLPKESSIEVSNGMTENINITFSAPGEYSYTIIAEQKNEIYYSPEYYIAYITVQKDSTGGLYATTVLARADSAYKPVSCEFAVAEDLTVETTPATEAETPTEVTPSDFTTPTQPSKNPPTEVTSSGITTPTQPPKNPPTSRPKTGDDNKLDIYLLICIAASGGLFALSIFYAISTDRLIGKR